MEVKFIRNGVFTSLGKCDKTGLLSVQSSKRKPEVDLPDDEANNFLQKGWCIPANVVSDGNVSNVDVKALVKDNAELRAEVERLKSLLEDMENDTDTKEPEPEPETETESEQD